MNTQYQHLKDELAGVTAPVLISSVLELFQDRLVIASSLGLEDQVITHMALRIAQEKSCHCRIFVIETGRLHQETLALMQHTQEKYQFTYEVLYPDQASVDALVSKKGSFSFYDSIENRKECCHIRKVVPLQQILATADAWITGQRQDQAVTRNMLDIIEWDVANQKIKFNPLADWDSDAVWAYIKQHNVPYNVLHDRGYPSIGCEPCTRAVKPGEDARAGRWWWEAADQKECGLHSSE